MNRSITIHPATGDDLQSIKELVAGVGWPHRTEDIKAAMDLGHTRLARVSGCGRISGVAMMWAYGRRAARIGLVVVGPDYQGRGIGRRLVERLLVDTGSRAVMLLSTESGRPLYEKLGFRIVGSAQRHQGVYRRVPLSDPRIRLATIDDQRSLMQLDASATGADRGRILAHLFEVGHTTVLAVDGQPTGFAVERAFGLGSVVGPIVAPSELDAIALFNACARPGFVRVDRPIEAELLGRHLEGCELEGEEVSDEMVLGAWPPTQGPARIFAMAGHAWG